MNEGGCRCRLSFRSAVVCRTHSPKLISDHRITVVAYFPEEVILLWCAASAHQRGPGGSRNDECPPWSLTAWRLAFPAARRCATTHPAAISTSTRWYAPVKRLTYCPVNVLHWLFGGFLFQNGNSLIIEFDFISTNTDSCVDEELFKCLRQILNASMDVGFIKLKCWSLFRLS